MRLLSFFLFALLSMARLAAAALAPTPAETLAEFETVCARLTAGGNPFFGESIVAQIEQQLAATSAVEARRRLLSQLAIELVRLGRTERALEVAESIPVSPDPELESSRLPLLAVIHLRLAEERNCLDSHTADSCLLPIRPGGVHSSPEHARRAGDLYLAYLALHPEDLHRRWLLNLTRMLSGDWPQGVPAPWRLPEEALQSDSEIPRWFDIAPHLQVNVRDHAGGAVMDDFDGDGRLDLISSSWHPCEPLRGFRNRGDGRFEDVSEHWGLTSQLGGLNLVHGDYDNDGRLDLLVLRGAWMGNDGRIRNSLLRNDLDRPAGRFVDATGIAGIAYPAYPTQAAAWGDYDGDGDLDLFVGNEAQVSALMAAGATTGEFPSQLFRNNGDGTFTDVARAAGVANHRFTKGAAWGDFDNDDDLDLYVSTFAENRLYRNNGDGTFTDLAVETGVTGGARATFATWFFDYDNDGDLDILVNDYGAPVEAVTGDLFGEPAAAGQPFIFRNDGIRFEEVSRQLGLHRPALPMGSNYGDLDNDGWLDFYLGTGIPDVQALIPNRMYRNLEGRHFEDVTYAGGFGHLQKGHGVAFGDLDGDGDQDLFHQLGGAYPYDAFTNALFLNPGNDQHWIVLRLRGRRANRFGLGARIEVRIRHPGGLRSVHAVAGSGGSFGSSSLQQELGLGAAQSIESVSIRWPGSGRHQRFEGPVALDGYYLVDEDEDRLQRLAMTPISLQDHRHDSQQQTHHSRKQR